MNFEEFENLARIYTIGALEPKQRIAFEEARQRFGPRAEEFLRECGELHIAMALSLEPKAPHPDTKKRLMQALREETQTGAAPVAQTAC